jgi:hypothetical protein
VHFSGPQKNIFLRAGAKSFLKKVSGTPEKQGRWLHSLWKDEIRERPSKKFSDDRKNRWFGYIAGERR